MRTFEHFPEIHKCPVCQTNEDKECCLIAIAGTQNGNNIQAIPVHTDCLLDGLFYSQKYNTLICDCKPATP